MQKIYHSLYNKLADLFFLFYSQVVLVYKRLRFNLGLSISAVLGIVAVLAMVVCVPIFAHAVSSEVLRQQLEQKAMVSHRSLVSMHMYYLDKTTASPMNVEKARSIASFISGHIQQNTGMQVQKMLMEVQTTQLPLLPYETTKPVNLNEAYISLGFAALEELPSQADLVEGQWPAKDQDPNGPVQVALLENTADESYINLGDKFRYNDMIIEVVGIWKPKNELATIWFEPPTTNYKNKMWVPISVFENRLEKFFQRPLFYSSWYLQIKEDTVHFDRAAAYARGLVRLDAELRRLLPGITTDYTPLESLNAYQNRAETLTTLFYAVGGPMVVLALLFISQTASIAVQQYEQETATMRGRGTSWPQVVALNVVESVLLIILALPFAMLVGWLAADVMGRTLSFLKFTDRRLIPFSLEGMNLLWILIGSVLIIAARFLPTLSLSKTTIVRLKQESSRSTSKPLWQRLYLDFLLLVPGLYAYITMSGLTKPAKVLSSLFQQQKGEQYRDPLMFVAPSLFAMAICLIALRLPPLLMRLFSAIADRMSGVWAYLSIQQIARRPQDHASALLLIMISLSLSIYSASTAKTLDQWMHDSAYYQSGSDLAVHEYVLVGGNNTGPSVGSNSNATISDADLNMQAFLSLEDHLKLPSVQNATRVGKYEGTFSYGVGELPAVLMGIDRLDFPKVAFFRDDFAKGQSLGALMNMLGANPYGVLVPSQLTKKIGFRVGDQLMVSVKIFDQSFDKEMTITGTYDYFPTIYPDEGKPVLIANLDSLFDNPDSVIGYDTWLSLKPGTDPSVVVYQLRQMLGTPKALVDIKGNALGETKKMMDQPERIGLFGVLNVGFIATGLMPGIGFVLYSYASMRRRFIQLGILQAIGLSVRQLVGYLALEQILLMGLAIVCGAAIGLLTSYMFVPFLQVGGASSGLVPPFKVLIGWAESGWLSLAFAFVLLLTVVGTIAYLAQMKVFQAVKMGETL